MGHKNQKNYVSKYEEEKLKLSNQIKKQIEQIHGLTEEKHEQSKKLKVEEINLKKEIDSLKEQIAEGENEFLTLCHQLKQTKKDTKELEKKVLDMETVKLKLETENLKLQQQLHLSREETKKSETNMHAIQKELARCQVVLHNESQDQENHSNIPNSKVKQGKKPSRVKLHAKRRRSGFHPNS